MAAVELFENERATNYDAFVQTWIPGYSFLLDSIPILLENLTETSGPELLVAGCGTGGEIVSLSVGVKKEAKRTSA